MFEVPQEDAQGRGVSGTGVIWLMAKKKKPMAAHVRATLHRDITEKVTALIARCEWLRDRGRMDEARRMLVRIERLTKELEGLEGK